LEDIRKEISSIIFINVQEKIIKAVSSLDEQPLSETEIFKVDNKYYDGATK
jgi:hypothetical protein